MVLLIPRNGCSLGVITTREPGCVCGTDSILNGPNW